MSELLKTEIRLVHLFPDGRKGDLGTGEIDERGIITATAPAAGQEAYLTEILGELNAREDVILKEPPTDPDAPPFAVVKRRVGRDDPEFLAALPVYTARIYALELRFDAGVLQPSLTPDLGAPSAERVLTGEMLEAEPEAPLPDRAPLTDD